MTANFSAGDATAPAQKRTHVSLLTDPPRPRSELGASLGELSAPIGICGGSKAFAVDEGDCWTDFGGDGMLDSPMFNAGGANADMPNG